MTVNPYKQYRKTQIETSNPMKLVLMLYNGAIKFLALAQKNLEETDYATFGTNIYKGQQCIQELNGSLNPEVTPEITSNLSSLYNFMCHELFLAHIRKDNKKIGAVLEMLKELKATWVEALESQKVATE